MHTHDHCVYLLVMNAKMLIGRCVIMWKIELNASNETKRDNIIYCAPSL